MSWFSNVLKLVDTSKVADWVRSATVAAITVSGVASYLPWVTHDLVLWVSGAIGVVVAGVWSTVAKVVQPPEVIIIPVTDTPTTPVSPSAV